MIEGEEGASHEVFRALRTDKSRGCRIREDDPVPIRDKDGIGKKLDQVAMPLLGLAECLLCQFVSRVIEEVPADLL
jgi:hypothetical protein